jgi:hypothetical protein
MTTTTPTLQDLQLALLAFDAYNRGSNIQILYNKKVTEGTTDPDPSAILTKTIGDATWVQDSDKLVGGNTGGNTGTVY